jgi:8-oxo-dGTP pyrophosphatase MutT (NUDIX family)
MEGNYIKKIRAKIGKDNLILPAARIIIENEKNEILVIERADNGKMGIPAGSIGEGETIEECIKREVMEETGIKIIDLDVIGISTNPATVSVEYMNGDRIQYFTIEFYSNQWEGIINIQDRNEVKCAKFVDIGNVDKLPINELSAFESLNYFKKNKKIMLK